MESMEGRGEAKKEELQGGCPYEADGSSIGRLQGGGNDPVDGEGPNSLPDLTSPEIGFKSDRAFITMEEFQERHISDLLMTIRSSEVAGQHPISDRVPSLTSDDRDDDEGKPVSGLTQSNEAASSSENVAESPIRRDYHSVARDKAFDQVLVDQQRCQASDSKHQQLLEWRKKLPCFGKKQEILDAVNRNQVIVISGETGCGKTTQVAQFILDSWIEDGVGSLCRVICIEPPCISAISIAKHVADERGEKVGKSVGYQIQYEQKIPRNQGSITYCTAEIMLKLLESDPYLANISHIILDHVHERDIFCDFLMIILRDLIRQRRDLKLILLSATLSSSMFSEYFGSCPTIHIPGCTFPVKEFFLEDVIEMIKFVPDKANFQLRENDGNDDRRHVQEYQAWINQLDIKLSYSTGVELGALLSRNLERALYQILRKYSRTTMDVLRSLSLDDIEINYDLVSALIHCVALTRPLNTAGLSKKTVAQTVMDGAILVFVPGWEEVTKVMDRLASQPFFSSGNFRIIPLHSMLSAEEQRDAFDLAPPGQRKVVIATNIAETRITIDDVIVVINCGIAKVKRFDVEQNLTTLKPEWISRANARQRRSRAGRVCQGECFHLFSTFREARLDDYLQPEMLRTRLEELCLQIKLLKPGKIEEVLSRAMEPPSRASIDLAVQLLVDLGAMTTDEQLTPLGIHLAKLPVDAHIGKMLVFAALFSCLDPILTVISTLSFKDAFHVPKGKENYCQIVKTQFARKTQSDHLLMANAYESWEKANADGTASTFCRIKCVSDHTFKMLKKMREQLAQSLYDLKLTICPSPKSLVSNRSTDNLDLVKAVICAGLHPNVVHLETTGAINPESPLPLYTKCGQRVSVHPKSAFFTERTVPSHFMVYHLKMQTKKTYLYDCTPVSPLALLLFGGDITCREEGDQNILVVDQWIEIGAKRRVAEIILDLKNKLDGILGKKISACQLSGEEKALWQAIPSIVRNICH